MAGIIPEETLAALTALQHRLFSEKRSTLIIIEGPGGDLMSRLVNEFMSIMEPRGIEYHHFSPTDEKAKSETYSLFEAMKNIPAEGKIAFYDRCWYSQSVCKKEDRKLLDLYIPAINSTEKYYTDNGVLIVKVFLNAEQDLDSFRKTYPTVSVKNCGFLGDDESDIADYSFINPDMKRLIEATNTVYAPWDVIKMEKFKNTFKSLVDAVMNRVLDKLNHPLAPYKNVIQELYRNPRETADYSKTIDPEKYKKKLESLQEELAELQCKLSKSDKSLILVFEGWDAAGKGGTIKRITRALNPRGYRAVPIPAPTAEEKAHTHLWRFMKNIPPAGHIRIFDRSWYGRMMVEPIEGLCTEEEYNRAGNEINNFESLLTFGGKIVIKFWIDITKDEQLVRFNGRANDPDKQWKLTDEDWRNREKWDIYEKYVNSMIKQTNTSYAPWYVIENNDKKYGRIKVLEIINDTLKRELK